MMDPQADSLCLLLRNLEAAGVIRLSYAPDISPHGISCIEVMDPAQFRRSFLPSVNAADGLQYTASLSFPCLCIHFRSIKIVESLLLKIPLQTAPQRPVIL